ncbi:hypothetical protein OROMI_032186 [Orobanche minor]
MANVNDWIDQFLNADGEEGADVDNGDDAEVNDEGAVFDHEFDEGAGAAAPLLQPINAEDEGPGVVINGDNDVPEAAGNFLHNLFAAADAAEAGFPQFDDEGFLIAAAGVGDDENPWEQLVHHDGVEDIPHGEEAVDNEEADNDGDDEPMVIDGDDEPMVIDGDNQIPIPHNVPIPHEEDDLLDAAHEGEAALPLLENR